MKYLTLTTTDPAFNLAAEQYVFDTLAREESFLMLWQNDNAIIIGKHQNTLAEINEAFVESHGIKVVRRLSGGGAVYHDMGNLNYTLIAPDEDRQLDLGQFCRPVIHALQKLGVDAQLNGRNDMTIEGKKFSGNAQYRKDGRVMHHGTILFDSEMSVLAGALQVDEEKIKAKGVRSVRSRVTNVRPCLPRDMELGQFRQALLECILEEMPGEEYRLTEGDIAAITAIRNARYDTWEWNYGRSPACDLKLRRRFEGVGIVEAFVTLNHGIIEGITFRGDYFSLEDTAALEELLMGCKRTGEDLEAALAGVDVGRFFHGLTKGQLIELICS